MYKSPIEIVEDIQNTVSTQLEEWIVSAVISCGINVDKERLLHALEYDQYAYEIGYSNGRRDAMKEMVRCKDCELCNIGENDIKSWCWCLYWSNDTDPAAFCSYGKRKDGANDETVSL